MGVQIYGGVQDRSVELVRITGGALPSKLVREQLAVIGGTQSRILTNAKAQTESPACVGWALREVML